MYQIAVCDDEEAIRSQIIRVLSAHPSREAFSIVEFSSGEALLNSLRAGQAYLLLILDIQLQDQNGVTVGRLLREELGDNATQVLYISAHTQYAMELFDVRPINFLTKPLNDEKLSACVTQALELAPNLDKALTLRVGKQALRIPLREIRYLESYQKRLTIHTTRGDHVCAQRLSDVLSSLPQPDFFQIHQSFVVNDLHIHSIRYDHLTLDDGTELSISQNFRKQVRELIFQSIPKRGGFHA